MAAIYTKIIRSPARQRLVARASAGRDEVLRVLRDDIAQAAIGYMEEITENWKHKQKFEVSRVVARGGLRVYVRPVGENAKYWTWTSEGTKEHPIIAKRKKTLAFRLDYDPKTTPKPTWGGPGISTGKMVFPVIVPKHPGTKPREFEKYIAKQMAKSFRKDVENAFRRGVRR